MERLQKNKKNFFWVVAIWFLLVMSSRAFSLVGSPVSTLPVLGNAPSYSKPAFYIRNSTQYVERFQIASSLLRLLQGKSEHLQGLLFHSIDIVTWFISFLFLDIKIHDPDYFLIHSQIRKKYFLDVMTKIPLFEFSDEEDRKKAMEMLSKIHIQLIKLSKTPGGSIFINHIASEMLYFLNQRNIDMIKILKDTTPELIPFFDIAMPTSFSTDTFIGCVSINAMCIIQELLIKEFFILNLVQNNFPQLKIAELISSFNAWLSLGEERLMQFEQRLKEDMARRYPPHQTEIENKERRKPSLFDIAKKRMKEDMRKRYPQSHCQNIVNPL